VNLYAAPKLGKSYMALQLACDVAQGQPDFLGFPIRAHGTVAYLQLDTPRSLWAARIEALRETGVSFDNVAQCDSQGDTPYPFNILNEQCFAWLAAQIDTLQPALTIIDTLREVHGGEENDSGAMREVVNRLVASCRPSALLLISHSRKENPMREGSVRDDNRGSGYVAGRMDTIIQLSSKHLSLTGRAIEDQRLPLKRLGGGFWGVGVEEELAITRVLADSKLHSLRERAAALSTMIGKSEEACRSMLRRRAVSS
jgi:RecA-family ATPase